MKQIRQALAVGLVSVLGVMAAGCGSVANPSGVTYPAAGSFATVPQLDRAAPRSAPRNGEHSEAVLAERLGMSSGQIAALIDQNIVGTAR